MTTDKTMTSEEIGAALKAKMIITVGIPGAGKSFEAIRWVSENTSHRARVNRDMIRKMMQGGWLNTAAQEHQTTLVQHAGIRELLREGMQVIVDDTNLNPAFRANLLAIATEMSVPFEVWDLTGISLRVALENNAKRWGAERLDNTVIARLHGLWLSSDADGSDPLADVRKYVTTTF